MNELFAEPDAISCPPDDRALLRAVVRAVEDAGRCLRERFDPEARPADGAALIAAIKANDAAATAWLRPALAKARPAARWADEGVEDGALPTGEWWVVDACEGNVNHVHGMDDWGVTATLVRDGQPVLAAVTMPAWGHTYTALAGVGAFEDGKLVRVSRKDRLDIAMVATGQAKPREEPETLRRHGRSAAAMLEAALLVRVSVPTTVELVRVATGRMDGFWQFSDVRSGLLAGALLVAEAGGVVTDARGQPWDGASVSMVAAAPGVHAGLVAALDGIG